MSTARVRLGDLAPQASHVFAPLLVVNALQQARTERGYNAATFNPADRVLRDSRADSFENIRINPVITSAAFQPVLETLGMATGLKAQIGARAIVHFGSAPDSQTGSWFSGFSADMSVMSLRPTAPQHAPCRTGVYNAQGQRDLSKLDALPWNNGELTQSAFHGWVDRQAGTGWTIPVVGRLWNSLPTMPASASKAEYGALFSAMQAAGQTHATTSWFGLVTRQEPYVTRQQVNQFYEHPLDFWSNVMRMQLGQTVAWPTQS